MKKIAIEAAYLPHPGDEAIVQDIGRVEVTNVQGENGVYQFEFNGPAGPQWAPISSIKQLIPAGYPG